MTDRQETPGEYVLRRKFGDIYVYRPVVRPATEAEHGDDHD